jgi:hypothetical protein
MHTRSCTSSEAAHHTHRSIVARHGGRRHVDIIVAASLDGRKGDQAETNGRCGPCPSGCLLALGRLSSQDPAQRRRRSVLDPGSGGRPPGHGLMIRLSSAHLQTCPCGLNLNVGTHTSRACLPASPMWCVSFLSLVQQPGPGHATVAFSKGRRRHK